MSTFCRYKGVTKHGAYWSSSVVDNGIRINCGNYDSPEDAARAYDKAARKVFGKEAATNKSLGILN